jgi:hypothetical protein
MKKMAEGQGLEPRFTGPEPVVLPLDDPSVQKLKTRIKFFYENAIFPFRFLSEMKAKLMPNRLMIYESL